MPPGPRSSQSASSSTGGAESETGDLLAGRGRTPAYPWDWRSVVRGWNGLVLAVVLAALGGVVWLALVLVEQSHTSVVDRFLNEEQLHLDEDAGLIEADLNDVVEDLHLAVGWLAQRTPDQARPQLLALLDIGHPYHAVLVLNRERRTMVSIADEARAAAQLPMMREAAASALARRMGVVGVTALGGGADGWVRIFTMPYRDGALALLVDTAPFFTALPQDQRVRFVLLDGESRPLPATDPLLRVALSEPKAPLYDLIYAMRKGSRATLRWSREQASAVIAGMGETVVSVLPLHLRGAADHWSLAVLRPIEAIGAQERGLIARIALTAAAVASCLVALAAYLIIGGRRSALLQERLRTAQELAHLHEKTEKIADHIPAAVLVLSEGGQVTAANRAFYDRARCEVLGRPWGEAFPSATRAALDRVGALVEQARGEGGVASLPGVTLALFDGEGRYNVHAVPLQAPVAEAHLLLVIEDLSPLRALEDQLLRAEKLATVGVLAAGIAHEIGTPLGIVRGRAEYIRGKLTDGHPQAAGLSVILSQIDLISRTIRQLLDFSRAKPATLRAVRLATVARAVAELVRFEAEARRVSIAVSIDEALPPLLADADQLQQVLVNLVMNALDATPPEGHVRLEAVAERKQGRLRIVVQDNGAGIAAEHRNQVFDPFFTTKKRGQGTGLGLTLCAQILRDHGGQIEVDSELGRGTAVTLFWPCAKEEAHGASEANHFDRR